MIINDLCEEYKDVKWFDMAINDLLVDRMALTTNLNFPRSLLKQGAYEKIQWMVDFCEYPYSLEEIKRHLETVRNYW